MLRLLFSTLILLPCLASAALGQGFEDALDFGRLLDDKFLDEVFAPVHHTHFSENGTPYVLVRTATDSPGCFLHFQVC
jgi:hypothetical protein